MKNYQIYFRNLILSTFILGLTACGGGSEEVEETLEVAQKACETSDSKNSNDSCGTLLLGITDADGDFLNYTVQVTGIELVRADGIQVSVMPSAQSINFTDYVEVSELATAATVPVGIYVSGSITVAYTDADIQIEQAGESVSAQMVDAEGNVLTSTTLELQFDESNRLIVARRRAAMLEIDFNLAASHTVDLDSDPVTVTTEPYIIAEIDPVSEKDFRVRGPLIEVNEADSLFRIAVRPFYRTQGRFGGVDVLTNDETNFEVDGEAYVGAQGLTQMATLEQGTPTVTLGTFNRDDDSFTAITVIAGSGVPGATRDAAKGVIVAREGNTLTVKGAALIRTDGEVSFDDEITVEISELTKVSKNRRMQDEVTIDDLSVGQAVTLIGDITERDGQSIMDATEGAIRMRLTFASGHVISEDGLVLEMNLQSLQGRRTDTFDFSGTGMEESTDANPDNYEVAIDSLMVTNLEQNDPVRVSGFVNSFASAPADFSGHTVINYSESRSQIFVNWPEGAEVIAFSNVSSESLIIDTEAEGGVYKLLQGGIRTDISSFETAVTIQPIAGRGLYTIKSVDGMSIFSNFADFASVVQLRLDEGNTIDLMHASGGYSSNNNTLSALKIAIKLN